jgi:hypothetical protein
LLLSLFLVLGCILIVAGSKNLWYSFKSPDWPRAPARVVQSETASSVTKDSNLRTSSKTYSATIVFDYEVNKQRYTTENIYFGQTLGSDDASEAELRKLQYPAGAEMTVSYNPDDPSIAAALPGFHADVLWLPGAGLAFIVPSIMFILFGAAGDTSSGMAMALTLFSVIFVAIGVAMLIPGGIRLWHGRESQNWPVAPGTVIYGSLDRSDSARRDSDGDIERSTTYGARLIYSYEVGGKKYFSNNRRFGALAGADRDWAEEIMERYTVGAPVQVWYSPSDPQLAVTEPGINEEAWYLPGAGLAFLLFGLAAYFFGMPTLTRT